MASLSNINGLFDVHSTGAILFSNTHGTSGQILRSNGNAAPTWVAASTVIGGPYLPLTGGTLTGPLSGTSATFSGIIYSSGGFRTGSTNSSYNLLTRNNSNGSYPLYCQNSLGVSGDAAIARFAYGSYGANTGTAVLDVRSGTSYFNDCNLGIGTTSPERILHVESDSVAAIQLENTSEADSFIDFKNPSRTFRVGYDDSADVFKVAVTNFNSNALVVNSSGNIGIGTASPYKKLEVVGDLQLDASNASMWIKSGATGTSGFINWTFNSDDTVYNKIGIDYDTRASTGFHIDTGYPLTLDCTTYIDFKRSGGTLGRWNSTGLGIGTDDPVGKTDIFVGASGYTNNITTLPVGTWSFANGSGSNSYPSLVSKSNATGAGMTLVAATDDGAPNGMDFNIRKGYNTDFSTLTTSGFTFSRFGTLLTTILRNGNVGIGTASPSGKLHVSTGTDTSVGNIEFFIGGTNAGNARSGKIIKNTTSPYEMTIRASNFTNGNNLILNDTGGNVGIGNTNPDEKLEISGDGTGYPYVKLSNPSQTGRYLKIGMIDSVNHCIESVGSSTYLTFKTVSVEKMRITSGGVFLVKQTVPNTTGDGFGVHPTGSGGGNLVSCHNGTAGAALIVGHGAFDGTIVDFRRASTQVGTISVTSSATAYNTSSDYRLKENVVPMEGALDRVDALKPFRFNFIADADKTVDGFLAHEVQDIVPEAITGEKDAVDEKGNPEYQGIDQSKLVPLLVAAIQELKAEIELLKSK